MSKKFTEEQYHRIVEIADKYQSNSGFGIIGDTDQKSLGAEFYVTELRSEINFRENAEEMMAIVNPLTREWAHEKFVEKEKKYYWDSEQPTLYGDNIRLFKEEDGNVSYSITAKEEPVHSDELLTVSEVSDSIYDINKFDKEEVE